MSLRYQDLGSQNPRAEAEALFQEELARVLAKAENGSKNGLSPEKVLVIAGNLKRRYPVLLDEKERNELAQRQNPEAQQRKDAKEIAIHVTKSLEYFAKSRDREAGGINNSGEIMVRALEEVAMNARPIPIVGFWGVGTKDQPDSADADYIELLKSMDQRIAAIYAPGTEIRLILATTHGKFNGKIKHTGDEVFPGLPPYLAGIRTLLSEAGIGVSLLDVLYDKYSISVPETRSDISGAAAMAMQRNSQQLIESAQRHNNTGIDPELAASLYVEMRLREIPMLTQEASGGITICKGSKDLGLPFHPIPTVFLPGKPPWFIERNPISLPVMNGAVGQERR